jgi:hypothetical protein
MFIAAYISKIIHVRYNRLYNAVKNVITTEINALQCLRIRTLVPPKGRGGMYSGRLKYTIKKKLERFLYDWTNQHVFTLWHQLFCIQL